MSCGSCWGTRAGCIGKDFTGVSVIGVPARGGAPARGRCSAGGAPQGRCSAGEVLRTRCSAGGSPQIGTTEGPLMSHASVLALVGPTAVGKTNLALRLAELLPIEVVSADSRTVYRWMDIGTAKPTLEERRRLPHHLLDV